MKRAIDIRVEGHTPGDEKDDACIIMDGVDVYPGMGQGGEGVARPTVATGLAVATIDELTLQLIEVRSFSCRDAAGRQELAALLEDKPPGRLLVVASRGPLELDERAIQAIESLGSARVRDLSPGQSWCLIGVKGSAPGLAKEAVGSAQRAVAQHKMDLAKYPSGAVRIKATSLGFRPIKPGSGIHHRGAFSIDVEGPDPWWKWSWSDSHADHPGVFMALLDETGHYYTTGMYLRYGARADAQEFADAIGALPANHVAILACSGNIQEDYFEDSSVVEALRSLGSREIGQYRTDDSWAMITRRGARAPLAEARSSTKTVEIEYRLPIPRQFEIDLSVAASVDRRWDKVSVAVDRVVTSTQEIDWMHGLAVFVLDERDCRLVDQKTWSLTGADQNVQVKAFTGVLAAVPPERLVLVAANRGATNLLERDDAAKRELARLGVLRLKGGNDGHRLAAIGRKVGPLPRGLEVEDGYQVSLRYPLQLRYRYLPAVRPCIDFEVQATASVHGATTIQVHGAPIVSDSWTQTGTHVVVIDKTNGHPLDRARFSPNQMLDLRHYIEEIPIGCVVAVATKGVLDALEGKALAAIGCLGLRHAAGDAYAAVGIKGAPPGTALEQTSAGGVAAVCKLLPYGPPPHHQPPLAVRIVSRGYSSDADNGAAILDLATTTVHFGPNGCSRGLNIATFDAAGTCNRSWTFDTHANDSLVAECVTALHQVPPDGYVAIAIMNDGVGSGRTRFPDELVARLKDLGSRSAERVGYRDSWCFVARETGHHSWKPTRPPAPVQRSAWPASLRASGIMTIVR